MATIVEAVEEAGVGRAEIAAVGFGIPVTLDRRTGMAAVLHATSRSAGIPFEAIMSERLGLPVTVDNDGNCRPRRGAVRRGAARRTS